MKRWLVTVCKTETSSRQFEVEANTWQEAEENAQKDAEELEWSAETNTEFLAVHHEELK